MNKALVTGASTGIGKAYAQRLARRGYKLVLVARDRARLEALASELGGAEVLVADLTQNADLARVEQKLESDPAISFFLNNAGIATVERHLETSAATIDKLIALNVVAATRLCLATDAERLLWRELRAGRLFGSKFKRQQPLGNYIVDFVCFESKLVVEVDGGQHDEQRG